MSQLLNLTVRSPGVLGLNTQTSGDVLEPGWATVATNLVIDEVGRLAKRKGTKKQTTAPTASSIKSSFVYVDGNGTQVTIVAAGNKIWKNAASTWTEITGTITAPTADNWKFQNFNGKCVGWQEGHTPIVLTTAAGNFADIVATVGTLPSGRDVLAAWGRLWVIDNDTLYYCDLLDETAWSGGTAGFTLLTRTWPKGVDDPVALAEFNGHLVIFGRRSIVIYQGPDDPASAFSTFIKVEGLDGIGCIARDTVVNVGRDLIWLSNAGLRTLSRVIQEKSLPTADAAPHVRDYLLSLYRGSTEANVKATYGATDGLYVLVFSSSTLAFDTRAQLPNGSFRCTEWDGGYLAPMSTPAGALYLALSGDLLLYTGELDGVASDGTGGSNIEVNYEGPWNDFGEEVSSVLKFLKKVKLYLFGGNGLGITFKWYLDYSSSLNAVTLYIPSGGTLARWGVAHYGLDRYSGEFSFSELSGNTSRSGRVVKVGIAASIGNVPFAISRIDLFAKVGKLSL